MFPGISRSIWVQISYPGTSLERREPELSFDTNLDGVSGFIVAETATLKSVRIYLIALVITVNGKVVFKSWMSPTCTTPLALTGTFCCGVMCNSHCLGKVIVLILPGQPQPPENHRLLSWDPFTFTKPQASSYEHYGIGSHQWDYVLY